MVFTVMVTSGAVATPPQHHLQCYHAAAQPVTADIPLAHCWCWGKESSRRTTPISTHARNKILQHSHASLLYIF